MSVYAGVFRMALDTYCGPVIRDEKTGSQSLAGLDLNPIASLAFRIGRSAYLQEMRRMIATTSTEVGLAFRTKVLSRNLTTDSQRPLTAPSVLF